MTNIKLIFGKTVLIAIVLLLSVIIHQRLLCQEPPNHQGHFGAVHCVAFSPEGTKIVTAGYDNTARIWDVESGDELHVLKGHRGHSAGINSVAFSPNGKKILTAGSDASVGMRGPSDSDGIGNIRIWDVETGKEIRKLEGYKGGCISAVFSPDGKKVVAAQGRVDDPTVLIWNADSGKVLQKFEGQGHRCVTSVAFSLDGKKIITTDESAEPFARGGEIVRIWDVESGKELYRFEGEDWDGIFTAVFFPDGKKILVTGSNGIARICDAESGKELQKLAEHTGRVHTAAFSPDGKKIVTASRESSEGNQILDTIRIWDADSGKELHIMEQNWKMVSWSGNSGLNSVVFSPDGKSFMTARDDTVQIWDAESGKELKKWTWAISYWVN